MSKRPPFFGPYIYVAAIAMAGLVGLRASGAAGISSPAPGQASSQAVDKPLQYDVSVVLKLVHVYVTDKKGNPVPDLAAGDFVVTDNGQPMAITDFEKRVLQASPAAPKVEEPVEAVAENAAPNPPDVLDTNRKFFLYFDFAYNNARGITKAKNAAFHFLDADVAPEDEVALLSYSMLKGLVVHEYLTTDHAKVRQALEAVGQKDIVGRADEVEEQYWQQAVEGLRGTIGTEGRRLTSEQGEVAETNIKRWESKQIAQKFLTGMTALAKALRIVPGQKQFILFSSGIPSSLLYGNQGGTPSDGNLKPGQGALFETGDPALRSQSEEMNREFGASGCVFYAFDTRESAMKTSMFDREAQTLETGKRTAFSPTSAFEANSIYKSDRITGLETLDRLAKTTGGQYFSNIDRYEKSFDQVQAVTGTFYVLGYPINERWDGKYHQVKVEVKRKGCEVRAQAGYFNPKPFAEYSDLEKQLHLFDLALNERALSRLPDRVAMGAFAVSAEGITRLAVLARLPEMVTAKFTGKRLEFVAIFFDAKGEIADMVREEIDPAPHRGRGLAFAAGSALKPGEYACRLVVRDMDSGMSAVGSAKAAVGKPLMTGLELGTPLVLEARTGCPLRTARAGKGRAAFPWADLYPYDSALFAPALVELPAGPASFKAVIPCAVPAGPPADLVLTANLINAADGARSPITITRVERLPKGPIEVLDLEFRAPDVPAGTYFLHFYVQDRAAGSLGHAFTTLAVTKR